MKTEVGEPRLNEFLQELPDSGRISVFFLAGVVLILNAWVIALLLRWFRRQRTMLENDAANVDSKPEQTEGLEDSSDEPATRTLSESLTGLFFLIFAAWFLSEFLSQYLLAAVITPRVEGLFESVQPKVLRERLSEELLLSVLSMATLYTGLAIRLGLFFAALCLMSLQQAVARRSASVFEVIGLSRIGSGSGPGLLIFIAMLPGFFVFAEVYDYLYRDVLGFEQQAQFSVELFENAVAQRNEVVILLIGLSAAVSAPLFEELLFRGLLFRSLLGSLPRSSARLPVAVTVSAAVFALVHFNFYASGLIFVLGVLLALVYHYTQNLWAAITLHFVFNSVQLGAAFYYS